MRRFFITGIGTDAGKTTAAAVLTETLNADYWKPLQAGSLDNSDTIKIRSLISNTKSILHPETYRLSAAMSPHAAAAVDGIKIDMEKFILPETSNTLIIEGAGGLMVPLNDKHFVIDLIEKFKAQAILVSRNYLGSINHTLLSAAMLKSRNIPVAGIIFNGKTEKASEEFILNYTGLKCLLRINEEKNVDAEMILKYKSLLNSDSISGI